MITVNNVGMMYEYPEKFAKVDEDVIWNILLLNAGSVLMMTRLLINDMKQRKKGVIVNVASGTALQPTPYAAVYGATKVSHIRSFCIFTGRNDSFENAAYV